MSHFTTIETQIKDIPALREAVRQLGFGFRENADCRGYADTTRKAPYVIALKGPYDIAVEPAPGQGGAWGLTTDWWGGHVERQAGPRFGRILQAYGVEKTRREAHARGLRVHRHQQEDGSILLTLEGGAL